MKQKNPSCRQHRLASESQDLLYDVSPKHIVVAITPRLFVALPLPTPACLSDEMAQVAGLLAP